MEVIFLKRIWVRIIIILILVSYGFGYVKYKQYTVENDVINYLKTDKNITSKKINTEPFISKMPGNKNWMVKVKIKGDSKVYSYYKNKDGNVVLDSYIEDGEVNIVDKVMK